ncbi:MAG TPA: sulfurtransferase [Candidatus Thermoplasmatota archaeon]|nr:sulfurtransferase [Candidatus Thermoplasmatota archaeon]
MNARFGPLVSAEEAAQHLDDPSWVFLDCRHDVADPKKGARTFLVEHVKGAHHAHTDQDLSSPVGDGRRGRHPLPEPAAFVAWASGMGIGPETRVVAYDDQAGQWASRLWWLLRHYGHPHVAVLDGGLLRWKSLALPLGSKEEPPRKAADFKGSPGHMPTIDVSRVELDQERGKGSYLLVDARGSDRYRGEVEPIDKRAGHIPGAVSVPYAGNVGSDMRFLPPERLLERYEKGLGVQEVGRVACYCGSGVTAPHDILAMEVAGMGTAALYPGSWSEWSWPEAERAIEAAPGSKAR